MYILYARITSLSTIANKLAGPPTATQFPAGYKSVRASMNVEELRDILVEGESQSCAVCLKEAKRSWTNSNGLENSLCALGKADGETSYGWDSYVELGEKPHPDLATVSLSHYPYNDSVVYRCDDCDGTLIIYLETGGYGARYQARWIRSNLQFKP